MLYLVYAVLFFWDLKSTGWIFGIYLNIWSLFEYINAGLKPEILSPFFKHSFPRRPICHIPAGWFDSKTEVAHDVFHSSPQKSTTEDARNILLLIKNSFS